MKRFVDIRNQLTGHRFAFWDTVSDRFETHGGSQAWDTFEDFANDCDGPIERYRGLAPAWAFSAIPFSEKRDASPAISALAWEIYLEETKDGMSYESWDKMPVPLQERYFVEAMTAPYGAPRRDRTSTP